VAPATIAMFNWLLTRKKNGVACRGRLIAFGLLQQPYKK